MQIPHEVQARPDTGLYNAKLGIWLFLASEVMLFGGLFSAYIFLRMGAQPGYWPHGLLNVPVGTFNTAVLIASSVTVVLAWASLKMRKFAAYKLWMGITIACGLLFLIVKLAVEWPEKFHHFGAFIKPAAMEKYEEQLGNHHMKEKGLAPRVEISGHLHEVIVDASKADKTKLDAYLKKHQLTAEPDHHHKEYLMVKGEHLTPGVAEKLPMVPSAADPRVSGVKIVAYEVAMDPANADPTNPENDRPHFWHKKHTEKRVRIDAADVESASAFAPKHSPYFAVYFTITGLHGLHVLAGVLVMIYFWLPIPGGALLYKKNPEHLANRVETVGLFWHFVDLVWIFVFPIFYLL
jgi:cytochrome c oxidase subunit III